MKITAIILSVVSAAILGHAVRIIISSQIAGYMAMTAAITKKPITETMAAAGDGEAFEAGIFVALGTGFFLLALIDIIARTKKQ